MNVDRHFQSPRDAMGTDRDRQVISVAEESNILRVQVQIQSRRYVPHKKIKKQWA
jgi:hypothetical protein